MKTRGRIFQIVLFVVLLTVPCAAFADKVGKPAGGGAYIEWQLNVSGHDQVLLTVSGPDGEVYSRSFASGKNPSFALKELAKIENGHYTYQLTVVPKITGQMKKQLEAARAAGDEAAARALQRSLGGTVVQSGGFLVENGSIVDPNAVESGNSARAGGITAQGGPVADGSQLPNFTRRPTNPVVNDQVIPDDLIVQGSACVGLDCVNNEAFGVDTIKMKENNTRIKYEDTSSSAGFATTDWQLTANDQPSGGLNRFIIEDLTAATQPFSVEGSAPTNSIYVDSNGKVGFRTSTPVLDLSVTTNDTPAIRLEQSNAGGFTAQTWDIGGNEANFFVRDITGGSRLPFRIRPGATTSAVDISSDGDVGINTASPNGNAKVDVFDSTQLKARIALTGQEYLAASNTSTDGVAMVLGVNRTNDRQLWIGDTSNIATQSSANTVIRFRPFDGDISAISTAAGSKNLLLQSSSGNVGIGLSSPTSKLHVSGDVRVTGGSFIDDGVTIIAPDYVFDESYKLMPLDELANFVDKNNHLPNVPSATEIKQNGLNMSQFQMRLLEKVEELTLYTIDQHEQIGSLKAQNEELLNRLANLEKQVSKKQ